MYVFPSMLDMTKVKFPTKAHRAVAEKVLLCNPQYFTMSALMEGAKIVADVPKDRIKKVTVHDLFDLGIMFPQQLPAKNHSKRKSKLNA
jgi:hypothetical protein